MSKKNFFPVGGKRGKLASNEGASGEEGSGVVQEEQQVVETVTQAIERHLTPGSHISSQDIPLDRILPNPFQIRQEFTDEDIEELAESLRQHGFFGTLAVRPYPLGEGFFELAYGERRWRAAQRVEGMDALPCRIVTYSDVQMEDIGLIENLQRKALNPLEEAFGLARKMKQINPATGSPYSIRTLAEHLGVKKNRVEEPLRLADMQEEVQAMVRQRPDTVRIAFEIAKLPTVGMRKSLIGLVLEGEASTRDIMYLVDEHLADLAAQEKKRSASFSLKDEPHTLQLGEAEDAPFRPKEMRSSVEEQEIVPLDQEQGEKSLEREVSTPAVSLDPSAFRRERQKQQDIKMMNALLRRWVQWAETGDGEKADMSSHVATWIHELNILHEKLEERLSGRADSEG